MRAPGLSVWAVGCLAQKGHKQSRRKIQSVSTLSAPFPRSEALLLRQSSPVSTQDEEISPCARVQNNSLVCCLAACLKRGQHEFKPWSPAEMGTVRVWFTLLPTLRTGSTSGSALKWPGRTSRVGPDVRVSEMPSRGRWSHVTHHTASFRSVHL